MRWDPGAGPAVEGESKVGRGQQATKGASEAGPVVVGEQHAEAKLIDQRRDGPTRAKALMAAVPAVLPPPEEGSP